jgi:hypothetical protein
LSTECKVSKIVATLARRIPDRYEESVLAENSYIAMSRQRNNKAPSRVFVSRLTRGKIESIEEVRNMSIYYLAWRYHDHPILEGHHPMVSPDGLNEPTPGIH